MHEDTLTMMMMKNKRLRVALAGSSGGGKTTLARLMGERWGQEPVVYSRPTAAARALGFGRPQDVPAEHMRRFQEAAYAEQLVAEGTADQDLVIDRSVLDYAAFYLYQTPGAGFDDVYVHEAVDHALQSYDVVFVVPPPASGFVVDDGKRHTDPKAVLAVHQNLLSIVNEFELEPLVHVLALDGPENRYAEAMAFMKGRYLLQAA